MKKTLFILFALLSALKMFSQCYSQISSKVFHNLTIHNDGTLWAWGANGSNQIGNNSSANQSTPIQIGNDNTWTLVSAGTFHSVALKADGTLWAWGSNSDGQTGNGNSDIPTIVGTDSDWVFAAAGQAFTAAIKSNGTLWMWGYNDYGQLGNGTTISTGTPGQVGNDHDWVAVSLGSQFIMALKSNGTLWAWGHNAYGQLGIGNFTDHHLPVQVGVDNDWNKIVAGYTNGYALKVNGTLWSWGSNTFGSVGNGSIINVNSPLQLGTDTWQAIAATHHFLGIKTDGTLWSWGRNTKGEVGNNNPGVNQSIPLQVGTENNWIECSTGFYHSLGLKDSGTLWAWGDNQYGSLGDGTFIDTLTPSQIGTACNEALCTIPTVVLSDIGADCQVEWDAIEIPTITDSCGDIITATLYTGNYPETIETSTTIVWKFTNASGSITIPQNVIISDLQSPVATIGQLPNITAQCQLTLLSDISVPTAIDNCSGQISGTTTTVFPITEGTTIITWIYDDGHGNTATQEQAVVIDDTQSPIAEVAQLPNITTQCQLTLSDISVPTALDNCAGQIMGTTTTVFPITEGTTIITWIYDDGHGNTAAQEQIVVIDDTQSPIAEVAQLPNITAQCQLTSSDISTPIALDNCSGQVVATTVTVFPLTSQGTTIITWIYNDGHGNSTTQEQTVVIDDTILPQVLTQNITVDLAGNPSVSITAEQIDNNSTDNCGISDLNIDTSIFNEPGTYEVMLTATDFAINSASGVAIVTVVDSTLDSVGFQDVTFTLYPLPVQDKLYIEKSESVIISALDVYDAVGRKVLTSENVEDVVDLSSLSSGGYFIVITTTNGLHKQAIIKK